MTSVSLMLASTRLAAKLGRVSACQRVFEVSTCSWHRLTTSDVAAKCWLFVRHHIRFPTYFTVSSGNKCGRSASIGLKASNIKAWTLCSTSQTEI